MAIRLWPRRSVVRNPVGARDFYVFSKFRLLGPPILLFSGYQQSLFGCNAAGGLNLTTQLHLVSRLRMSGAIRLLPPFAFVAVVKVKVKVFPV